LDTKEYQCIYCGKPSQRRICDKCLSERDQERLKRETVYQIEGEIKLNIFRKFLLLSVARSNITIMEEYFNSNKLYPEIIGRIKIHSNIRDVIGSFEIQSGEIVDIIRAEDIRQISYKSRSKLTTLRWKKIHREKGLMNGVATMWSLKNLLSAGADLERIEIKPVKVL